MVRFRLSHLGLAASIFGSLVVGQQYAGDLIPNQLPTVPGSEIAYFLVQNPTGANHNLTLINYYSLQQNDQRVVASALMRAVIVIHGLGEDPSTYEAQALSALGQQSSDPNCNRSTVAIMAPYFPDGDGKGTSYPWTPGLAPNHGSTSNCLVWSGSEWSAGANNQYPWNSVHMSSFTVLDQIIHYFDNTTLFPQMKQIVVAGHSLGAQMVQRYAAISQPGSTRSPVTYWIANPDSYAWMNLNRPLSTATCPTYDVYRQGYTNFTQYPMTYGTALVASGRSNILANFNSKQIAYARGILDFGDDGSGCESETQGSNRNERFFNYIQAFPPSCTDPSGTHCDTVDFVNAGHDSGQMMASLAGQARLFLDNFYGNGTRAYDFGCPRQQPYDNPYPDATATNCSLPRVDNTTVYAGNMTFWGCWSDQTPQSLNNLAYTSDTNSIENCTSTCAGMNNTIAGLEYGTQCFCGSALTSQASQTIIQSCNVPCSGNSSETCGGSYRLSVYSNGRPVVLPPPSVPATIGNFTFVSCFAEPAGARALADNSTAGSFMTLEYCASYCQNYKYFGAEYSSQ